MVEPGAELALHHHLGTQIARIQAGTLTYTVEQGSVVIYIATLLKKGAPPSTPVTLPAG